VAIEPGRFADMIAVSGNPIEDIKQLEMVKFVMRGGAVVRNDLAKP
jgi:imidazolonepropionase-like amidohydrolase